LHIALHHAGTPAQSFVRQPDHAGATINGDNSCSVACQPICVPARPTASVKNILALDIGQKGQCCGALVKRVPRPLVYPGRGTIQSVGEFAPAPSIFGGLGGGRE
jgi:hypothetical protein